MRQIIVVLLIAASLVATTSGEAVAGPRGAAFGPARAALTFGGNYANELGDDTPLNTDRPLPGIVDAGGADLLANVTSVVAAGEFNLALDRDGTVWSWGDNDRGQLGRGPASAGSPIPARVLDEAGLQPLANIRAVAAGYHHALALSTEGEVWAWGYNGFGELGIGSASETPSTLPVQVKGNADIGFLTGVVAIGAGSFHSVALTSEGEVWAWGKDDEGQAGDGTLGGGNVVYPSQVKDAEGTGPLTNVSEIASGWFHNLARTTSGEIWAWGENQGGQLGDGTKGTDRPLPVRVKDAAGSGALSDITQLAAGYSHSMALSADGRIWSWGANNDGQIGDGTKGTAGSADRLLPVRVEGTGGVGDLSGIAAIAVGDIHSLALTADGQAWAWGSNDNGQLGDGSKGTDQPSPRIVQNPSGAGPLSNILAISAGDYHSLVLATTAAATLSAPPLSRKHTIGVTLAASGVFRISGYYLSESATPPAAAATVWRATAPTTFSLGGRDGVKRVFGFARDEAGFVSEAASVRIRVDSVDPLVTIALPGKGAALAQLTQIKGTKADPAPRSGIASARYAIRSKQGMTCQWWKPGTSRLVSRPCSRPLWFGLPAGRTWTRAIGTLDDPGVYTLIVEATDMAGNTGKLSRRFTIVAGGRNGRGG